MSPTPTTNEPIATDADATAEETDIAQRAALVQALKRHTAANTGSASFLAPYAPTVRARRLRALDAARVTPDDVVYDLGSGTGEVLIDAAKMGAKKCVGLEIDETLNVRARDNALDAGVAEQCEFRSCDITKMTPDALARGPPGVPAPTVIFCWLTSGGLTRVSSKLRRAWEMGTFRIVTCVDSLDACVDYLADGAFAEPRDDGWEVSQAHSDFGIYVVPEQGVSVDEWSHRAAAAAVRAS